MTSPQVIITVAQDGTVQAKTMGVTGPDCLDYVAMLEDLLAATTVTSEFTADYQRSVTAASHNYAVATTASGQEVTEQEVAE
ncbi:DUF2997 domain-containing protein [Canibacter oris]|uniref:DUF2997 domain-containing protein n=1 Tax=Canibacter oris TaxID=1365628 RepID=A0A840DEG5_9MICO|nr:DUF2997 domain-containing protein [Canibacter oris]MBB4071040.1 hypothetical protein [Canibacter oris]